MLNYNEILPKKYIVVDTEPYEVLTSRIFRKQQGKPVNQTKLRSLKNGRVIDKTFHQSEKADEAELTKQSVVFLYRKGNVCWFRDGGNPRDRFSVPSEVVGEEGDFLKENAHAEALIFDNRVISIVVPIKVDLAVVEAPPSIRGNTSQGGNKQVTLESGAVISAPLFINEGDIVRVNTQKGEYVERVEKLKNPISAD